MNQRTLASGTSWIAAGLFVGLLGAGGLFCPLASAASMNPLAGQILGEVKDAAGVAQMGAYVASKSAVIRITEAMAAELRDKNINVNCVLPTVIDTPENRAAMPRADPSKWVAPADLARVIAFLASESARAIHGAAVPVTGLS